MRRLPGVLQACAGVLVLTGWAAAAESSTAATAAGPQPVAPTAANAPEGMPYPADILAWDDAEKERQLAAGAQLREDLAAAIKDKRKEFVLPKGHYRFAATSAKFGGPAQPSFLGISGAEDLVVDGSGSTFWFNDMATALCISRCDRLVVKNLIFDWDPLPFTQGRVIRVDVAKNAFVFRPDPGYDTFCDSVRTEGSPRGALFSAETRRLKPDQYGFSVWNFWKDRQENGDYNVRLRGFNDCKVDEVGFAPGDRFACWQRKGRTIRVELCGAVTLENITLYASPFIGFVEASGKGPTTYRQCRIIKRPGTNRLIAGNADGFNSSLMQNGPVLEQCAIDTIGDDFVNVHGVYTRVLAQESPDTLVITPHGWGGSAEHGTSLRLYDAEKYHLLGVRTATAERIQFTPAPNPLLPQKHQKWAASSNVEYGKPMSALRLKLNEPVQLSAPAILCCENVVGRGAIIRDCRFTGSLARGIRFQSIDAVIENNEIDWCAGPGLTLAGQPGFWGEATNSRNVLIRNNVFRDTCRFNSTAPAAVQIVTAGEPGISEPLQDIRFLDNLIVNPGGNGLSVWGARHVEIAGNTIRGYGDREAKALKKDPAACGFGIELRNAEEMTIQNNRWEKPGLYAKAERNPHP